MEGRLKVGVIGAGNMGRHHVRNYAEMPEAELVGITDPADSAAELAGEHGVRHYTNHVDMFEQARPEAVSIAIPTYLHHRFALDALSHGIHTLVEKPITNDETEAEELVKVAEANRAILTVGHVERFNPVVRELKKIIDSKQIGELTSIIAQRVGGFPRNEPETNVAIDLAIHDIDIVSYLTGTNPEVLAAHGTKTFHSSEIDSVEIMMRCNGASGFIQANWVTPVKIRQIALTGSKGYVVANYITQEISLYEHMAIQPQENFDAFVRMLGEPEQKKITFERSEPLRRELRAFVMAASGVTTEMLVTPPEAINALKKALEVTRLLRAEDSEYVRN